MKQRHLGEFEELVLLAVGGLGEEAYAVPIQQRIEERAGRAATMGAVYAALDRLEHKGFLASRLGEVTRQRGGKRKRFFEVTGVGLAAASAMRHARERTKEIGGRKVLGASLTDIVVLLSKGFATLVAVAFVVAVPLAYFAMDRWLQNFAYRIEISWPIFLIAGLSALLVALLTVSYHAVKAALTNPVDSLRYE